MWAHPCSDLIPILVVAKCILKVLTRKGTVKTVVLDESFFPRPYETVLETGDLILEVKVPFTAPDQVMHYYRLARIITFMFS